MEYSQGSVIYGLRSSYYEGVRCLGIVITARCEIAQGKAKVIHALTALTLDDWVIHELFIRAVRLFIANDLDVIKQWAKRENLDFSTLIEFGPEKLRVNLESTPPKKSERDKIEKALNTWTKICKVEKSKDEKEIKKILNAELSKHRVSILKELLSGRYPNEFCFIPDSARFPGGNKLNGIVVNLKDIIPLKPSDLERVKDPGIEYDDVVKEDKDNIRRLNICFYLEQKDDFVTLIDPIDSPWIEHLMQNFSNAFSRIGVDGATKDEIAEFCQNYGKEVED